VKDMRFFSTRDDRPTRSRDTNAALGEGNMVRRVHYLLCFMVAMRPLPMADSLQGFVNAVSSLDPSKGLVLPLLLFQQHSPWCLVIYILTFLNNNSFCRR
jgi:hypothetical protein